MRYVKVSSFIHHCKSRALISILSAAERLMASYESNFVAGQLAGMEMAKAITFKHVWSR